MQGGQSSSDSMTEKLEAPNDTSKIGLLCVRSGIRVWDVGYVSIVCDFESDSA